jgi:hypothetical protein
MLLRASDPAADFALRERRFVENQFSTLAGACAVLELSLRGSSRVSPSTSQQA